MNSPWCIGEMTWAVLETVVLFWWVGLPQPPPAPDLSALPSLPTPPGTPAPLGTHVLFAAGTKVSAFYQRSSLWNDRLVRCCRL